MFTKANRKSPNLKMEEKHVPIHLNRSELIQLSIVFFFFFRFFFLSFWPNFILLRQNTACVENLLSINTDLKITCTCACESFSGYCFHVYEAMGVNDSS